MHILGTRVHNITLSQATKKAERFLSGKKQYYIVTPNPEIVLRAAKNPAYRRILNRASLSLPDGTGLLWASKRLYGQKQLKERVAGVDFMLEFLSHLSRTSYWSYATHKVLLLGGKNGTARETALVLKKRFPRINFYSLENHRKKIINFLINEIIQPNCVFVALGAPKQELWISRNLKKFPSVKLAMGVGGAFDMITGVTPRAPIFFRKSGMEWLWRLLIQPRRLNRIFRASVVFPLKVIFTYPHLPNSSLCYNRGKQKSDY